MLLSLEVLLLFNVPQDLALKFRSIYIPQPTENISLDCIKLFIFVSETEYVYCAVRAEYLNRIQVKFDLSLQRILRSYMLCRVELWDELEQERETWMMPSWSCCTAVCCSLWENQGFPQVDLVAWMRNKVVDYRYLIMLLSYTRQFCRYAAPKKKIKTSLTHKS